MQLFCLSVHPFEDQNVEIVEVFLQVRQECPPSCHGYSGHRLIQGVGNFLPRLGFHFTKLPMFKINPNISHWTSNSVSSLAKTMPLVLNTILCTLYLSPIPTPMSCPFRKRFCYHRDTVFFVSAVCLSEYTITTVFVPYYKSTIELTFISLRAVAIP